jgi:serine/threonine-protein kinase HipA
VTRRLEVWCLGQLAGQLVDDDEGLTFTYDAEWVAAGNPPLSQSLPVDREFSGREVRAFFGGLLPEGELRKLLALELGVSDENDFSILEHVGGDCAGAVSLYVPGKAPRAGGGSVDWLKDAEVTSLVGELPQRPMYAGPDDEYRLSLAGAQNKLPVVVGDEWRIGLPRGGRPSTHILKIPIAGLRATVLNEAFCLHLGSRLGLDCATAVPRKVGGVEMLLVARYDRAEREGGPTLVDCVDLLRNVSKTPAADLPRFLDAWALSFLTGNHDAHGKNYSLLYDENGPALAPIYDVLSTIVYRDYGRRMDRTMAMKVGGQRYPGRLQKNQLDRFLDEAKYGPAPSRRRLHALAGKAHDATQAVAAQFKESYWWDPVLDSVMEIVERRAERLIACTAPI